MKPFLENEKFRDPSLKKQSLGIPLPENRKVTKMPFHAFDRYGIHIQAFVHFLNGKIIIFQSSSPQKYFKNVHSKSHQQHKQKRKHCT